MDDAGGMGIVLIVYLAVLVFYIAVLWKVFTKAGQPGWASIIPIYNIYVIIKIAGKPGWWLLLLLVPLVNIVIQIMISIALAERFGKGAGFGVCLYFFWFICYPILAFGDSQYTPPPAV